MLDRMMRLQEALSCTSVAMKSWVVGLFLALLAEEAGCLDLCPLRLLSEARMAQVLFQIDTQLTSCSTWLSVVFPVQVAAHLLGNELDEPSRMACRVQTNKIADGAYRFTDVSLANTLALGIATPSEDPNLQRCRSHQKIP